MRPRGASTCGPRGGAGEACHGRTRAEPGARSGMGPTGGSRLAVMEIGREEEGVGLGCWAGGRRGERPARRGRRATAGLELESEPSARSGMGPTSGSRLAVRERGRE
jgi:hypothetical protein